MTTAKGEKELGFSIVPGEVVVRWAATGSVPSAEARTALAAGLEPTERARLERFVQPVDAWSYLAAHDFLRRTLSACAPVPPEAWSFRQESGGRPEVERPAAGRRLRFSLSHTRRVVACAVGLEEPVGVDVEALDPALMPPEVERSVLAPAESRDLDALAGEARLERALMLWTLKEACLKVRGDGLAEPPSSVSFAFDTEGRPHVTFAPPIVDEPPAWRFDSRILPVGHALAAAVRRPPGRAVRFRVSRAQGPQAL